MKDNVKEFIEGTFEEIKKRLHYEESGYEYCEYSVEDGVLEIGVSDDIAWPLKKAVGNILNDKFFTLYGDDIKWEDYFYIMVYKRFDVKPDYLFEVKSDNLILNYYITVKAKIEKLEELFNENNN